MMTMYSRLSLAYVHKVMIDPRVMHARGYFPMPYDSSVRDAADGRPTQNASQGMVSRFSTYLRNALVRAGVQIP